MNGAEALIATLHGAGVDVCFANPGTSEMQLVSAIDRHDGMRAILGLFEGVVTGAADGYARMAERPAATLLHLGPGIGNGLANLHNARRAMSPIVNLVGEHATYHAHHDAPLTSDTIGVARPMSDWVRQSRSERDLPLAGAEAVAAASSKPGNVATVVIPADHAWNEGAEPATAIEPRPTPKVPPRILSEVTECIRRGSRICLYLGGRSLCGEALLAAGRVAEATGVDLVCETFPARMERGQGRPQVRKLPYFGEQAHDFLSGYDMIVLCGAKAPVSFFAYPGKPGVVVPSACEVICLADPREDVQGALLDLAESLGAASSETAATSDTRLPTYEEGPLNPAAMGAILAELMPEDAIVSDEAATCGLPLFPATAGARRHDWLSLTGGSIGQGLPVAVGAAVACPSRKVIALQADGSGMYTNQALWTMAREKLDVVTIIFNNGSYAILNIELARVGVTSPGPKALSMLDLTRPALDWTKISEGMGVPARRVTDTKAFREALAEALATDGPSLIEAMV